MNISEAAKKWGCSEKTVREYCKNGLIPLADKIGGKWEIPNEMQELPPITFKRAVYLLECLEEHVLPVVKGYWSEEKLAKALLYLSDMKFIIDYEGHASLEEAAEKCRVADCGKRLIRAGNGGNEIEGGGEMGIKVGVDRGLPTALANVNGRVKTKRVE